MLNMMSEELRNFCILVEAPRTPFGKPKKTYSGKCGGRNDDIVITLQLAITGCRSAAPARRCGGDALTLARACRQFYQSDKYVQFRPEQY